MALVKFGDFQSSPREAVTAGQALIMVAVVIARVCISNGSGEV